MKITLLRTLKSTVPLGLWCFFYFSCCANAAAQNYRDTQTYHSNGKTFTGTYGGLGGFSSVDGYRGGGELAATFWQQYTGLRTSGLIYSTEGYDAQSSLFAGYGLTAFGYVGDRLKTYAGLGIFVGENLGCDRYRDDDEQRAATRYSSDHHYCDEESHYLFAIYPEFGFALHLGPFQLNPFVRVYYDTEQNWDRVTASYGALIHWQIY